MSTKSHRSDYEVDSPEAHPSNAANSSSGRKPGTSDKKRKLNGSNNSSRGVANLTPEQLAKKRANDREAQRAIRERTKNQIEALEKKIRELTAQQPYQELQHALRQKELVEQENAEIKRRLSAVLDLIRPMLAGNCLPEGVRSMLHDDDGQSSGRGLGGYQPNLLSSGTPYHVGPLSSNETTSSQASPSSWHQTIPPANQPTRQQTGDSSIYDPTSSESRGRVRGESLPGLFRTTSAERRSLGLLPVGRPEIQRGAHLAEKPRRSPIASPPLPADSHVTISNVHSHPLSPSMQDSGRAPRPNWSLLPIHSGPSCPLDSLLMDFLSERRARLAEGASESEVLGPPYPSFAAILDPSRHPVCDPMTRFFRDILRTFPDICAPPEKVAVAYVMFLIMRWHCSPTAENFNRMPMWLWPTSWQKTIAHPIWIDHLPWVEMRNEIVPKPQRYPFPSFFVPYTKTLSLNWPYRDAQVFVGSVSSPGGGLPDGELVISPSFEAHLRNLDNWSLGTPFAREFPMLVASVRVEDHPRGEGGS